LFTAKTVSYMYVLGGIYFADYFLRWVLVWVVGEDLGSYTFLASGHLFAGPFIIFVGWLIDEARKIREEQELTV
jgi:hypothetical protein